MGLFEKLYTPIIFLAVMIGIGLGQFEYIRTNIEVMIVPLLLAMLYLTFLQIPIEDMRKAFKNIRFTFTAMIINFVWVPIFAWILATLFLADTPALYIGFIMLMVTPCTDWYLIFTGIAKGNVALSTAILPLNLIIQIILLPVFLFLFTSATGVIEFSFLLESIILILILPFALAVLTNIFLKTKLQLKEALLPKLSTLPILFLSFAIIAMFAVQGQMLLNNLDLLWQLLIPLFLFFIFNFIVGQKIGQIMKFSYRDRTSLSLTTLARNSPIALAIAMTAFPDQPLIALALVIGPLLELPILAAITQLLLYLKGRS